MNLIWWTSNEEANDARNHPLSEKLPSYIRHSLQRRLLHHRRGPVDHGVIVRDPSQFGQGPFHEPSKSLVSRQRVGILVDEEDGWIAMIEYPGHWTDETGSPLDFEKIQEPREDSSPSSSMPGYLTPTPGSHRTPVREDDLRWALGRLRRLKMIEEEETRFHRLGGELGQISSGLLLVGSTNPLKSIAALSACMQCTPQDAKTILDNAPIRIGTDEPAENLERWRTALERSGAQVRFGA